MVEGAPHTAKRSKGSIVVSMGCPLPPYIKEQGRRRPALGGARQGSRIPTPSWSRFPPFLVQHGKGGSPTPGRSRTPPGAPSSLAGGLPLAPLYTGAGGTSRHTIDLRSFSRVRCPPPPYYTSIIPLRSLGEALRRWNIIIVTTPSC